MDQTGASCSTTSPSMFMTPGGSSDGNFIGMGTGSGQLQDEPELCLVCNDVATGYHYGTPSCNGCKTFFRRTVMKKQVFQCQYDGNCPVDKSVRCACRHCRFKKCLAVGMNRDAIQQNRDPIGYTKRTRRYPLMKQQSGGFPASGASTSASTPFPGPMANNTPFPPSGSSSSMMAVGPSSSMMQSSSNNFMSGKQFGAAAPSVTPSARAIRQQQQHQQVSAEQVQEDLLLQRLIGIENLLLTIRNSKITVQKSLNELVMSRSVFEDPQLVKKMASEQAFQMPNVLRRADQEDYLYWHERDWLIMIEWAKMLPVYQQLSLSDKLALLRHSAITYPSLIQCFYTPDVGPDTIVFPNGAFFDRTLDPNKPTGFQRKNFKMLDNLLNPIRKMHIDQNEFAGAKAIFFLNPDSDADDLSPEAKAQIAQARSAITNALYRYMVHKRGTEEAADKFGKLLLLGTAIATMSCEMKEAVVVADFFDQIRFSGFARQLLLARDEEDVPPHQMFTPHSESIFGPATSTANEIQLGTALGGPMANGIPNGIPNSMGNPLATNMPNSMANGANGMPNSMGNPLATNMGTNMPNGGSLLGGNLLANNLPNGLPNQMANNGMINGHPLPTSNSTAAATMASMLNGLQQMQQQQQNLLMAFNGQPQPQVAGQQFGQITANANPGANNYFGQNFGQFGPNFGQMNQMGMGQMPPLGQMGFGQNGNFAQQQQQQMAQQQQLMQQLMAAKQQQQYQQQVQQVQGQNMQIGQAQPNAQQFGQIQSPQLGQNVGQQPQFGQAQQGHAQSEQAGQEQQKQQQKQQQAQLQLTPLGQTQLGPQSAETVLSPQDQQPFTPSGTTTITITTNFPQTALATSGGQTAAQQPQPPSAGSQQSFPNTSPPSLVNLA